MVEAILTISIKAWIKEKVLKVIIRKRFMDYNAAPDCGLIYTVFVSVNAVVFGRFHSRQFLRGFAFPFSYRIQKY